MDVEKKVLIFGDSLIKHIKQEEKTYKIFAAGGLTTERLIERLAKGRYDREIVQSRGVVIIVGTNNLAKDEPKNIVESLGQIRAIIGSKNRNIEVSLATIVPREDQWKDQAKTVSNLLSARGKTKGWAICQIHKTFIKKSKKPNQESLYKSDGLHLSESGLRLMRNFLLNYVDSHFKP